jgi:hypothetical protein
LDYDQAEMLLPLLMSSHKQHFHFLPVLAGAQFQIP